MDKLKEAGEALHVVKDILELKLQQIMTIAVAYDAVVSE